MVEWCLYCDKPLNMIHPDDIAACPNLPIDSCCCDSCSWYSKESDQEVSGNA